jgi:hypothetical protein
VPGCEQSHDAPGDRRLERALEAVAAALRDTGAPWAIIGGIAVIARGVRRMTTDIDAVIQGDCASYESVSRALAVHDVVPRIEDAAAFAASSLVLLLQHEPTSVDIDLSFGWTEFERLAIASSTEASFGRVRAPMARPQDLVVFKAIAGRPRDVEDVTALLLLHPDIDVDAARRAVTELAALGDAPELVDGLDAALRSAQSPSPRSPAPRKRKPRQRGK